MAVHMTRGQRIMWWLLLVSGVILAIAAGTALWAYQRLDGSIRTDHAAAAALHEEADNRPEAAAGEARNILVLGQDRVSAVGTTRSDTVLLLHMSGDGRRVEAVHVPRDLVVDIPGCRTPDGGRSQARTAQFNWAFQYGGAACTIRTFELLTGLRVDHHLVIGFEGFADVVDAVGGVEMDLPEAEYDPRTGHALPAGTQLLDGEEALGYVRARIAVGDGSDLNRLARQQEFLGSLHDRVMSAGTLGNPARLYPLLAAVTSAITADAGLDSLDELRELAEDVRGVPEGGLTFHTVPTLPHPDEPGRLVLDAPAAERLFTALGQGRPLPKMRAVRPRAGMEG